MNPSIRQPRLVHRVMHCALALLLALIVMGALWMMRAMPAAAQEPSSPSASPVPTLLSSTLPSSTLPLSPTATSNAPAIPRPAATSTPVARINPLRPTPAATDDSGTPLFCVADDFSLAEKRCRTATVDFFEVPLVYMSWDAPAAYATATFKRKWYLDGVLFLTSENRNHYAYLEVSQRAFLRAGAYRVELYVGDTLLQTGTFTIHAVRPTSPATAPTRTPTPTRTPAPLVTPLPTTAPVGTATRVQIVPTATRVRATPVPQMGACQRPPHDYRRVEINGEIVNARTLWMLENAVSLYEGRGSPLRVVQGSYVDTLAASFGTHAGGGAVDISIRVQANPAEVMSIEEAGEMVMALRQAGFAAWLRLPDDLDPPNALHIHAIAIGDQELSEEAERQLIGPEGYFRGLDGVPPEHGGTRVDRYGGPLICEWMIEMGYGDLRE